MVLAPDSHPRGPGSPVRQEFAGSGSQAPVARDPRWWSGQHFRPQGDAVRPRSGLVSCGLPRGGWFLESFAPGFFPRGMF